MKRIIGFLAEFAGFCLFLIGLGILGFIMVRAIEVIYSNWMVWPAIILCVVGVIYDRRLQFRKGFMEGWIACKNGILPTYRQIRGIEPKPGLSMKYEDWILYNKSRGIK